MDYYYIVSGFCSRSSNKTFSDVNSALSYALNRKAKSGCVIMRVCISRAHSVAVYRVEGGSITRLVPLDYDF